MLARAALRGLVAGQLRAADTLAGQSVFENRALSLTTGLLPAITVQTPADQKQSMLRGGPQFTSTVLLEIIVRVTGPTDDTAMHILEQLIGQVEAVTLSNQVVIDQVQQFSSVRTEQRVSVEGSAVLAEAVLHIECEIYEDYRAPPFQPLTGIRATVPLLTENGPVASAVPALALAVEAFDVPLPPLE